MVLLSSHKVSLRCLSVCLKFKKIYKKAESFRTTSVMSRFNLKTDSKSLDALFI